MDRSAQGVELHTTVTGDGPVVVLVPPVGLGAWVWRPVGELVAPRRTVVAVDLPGYGSPSLPDGTPWTVEAFAGAVAAHVEAHWPPPVEVAGVSLGGAIALELARRQVADRALAVSPIGFWTPREARYAVASLRATRRLARLARPVRSRLSRSAGARRLLLAQVIGHPAAVPPGDAEHMASDVAGAPFAATLPHTGRYRYAAADDAGAGVTIAWGSRDRLLPPRQAQRARQALPAARHVTLHGAGHVPLWDAPEALADLITGPAQP